MTTKERALQVLQEMPEDATLEEILERLEQLEGEGTQKSEAAPERAVPSGGAWDLLLSAAGTVEMPADWSAEHDHYLYGTPKRSSAA